MINFDEDDETEEAEDLQESLPISELKLEALLFCFENQIEVSIHKFDEDPIIGIIHKMSEDNSDIHLLIQSDNQVKHIITGTEGIDKIIYYIDIFKKNIIN